MKFDVFISYSTKDLAIAQDVFRELESAGIRCWMSKSRLISGKLWDTAIADALAQSRALVCILSHSSANSTWVYREVALAQDSQLPIIPYEIEAVNLPGGLQLRLKSVQWIDSVAAPMERIPDLIADLRTLLSVTVSPTTSELAISDMSSSNSVGKCPICNDENFAVLVAGKATWFQCKQCGQRPICTAHRDARTFVCSACAESNLLVVPHTDPPHVGRPQPIRHTVDSTASSSSVIVRPDIVLPPQVVGPSPRFNRRQALVFGSAAVVAAGYGVNVFFNRLPRSSAVQDPAIRPILSASLPKNPKLGSSFTEPRTDIELVFVPPGDFLMGDSDQKDNPRHTVKLSGYWISRTVITVEQYLKFCAETGVKKPDPPPFNPNWSKRDHPMVRVSWNNAQKYCKWAGLNLPTEAQWEKAARGTQGQKYPWGSGEPDPSKLWYSQNCSVGTSPVTRFKQGPYDLYDVVGNVWQWCRDAYDDGYLMNRPLRELDPVNNTANNWSCVLRGGCWISDSSLDVRASYRDKCDSTYLFNTNGFRVVAGP